MFLFIYLSMEFLMGNFNNLTNKMCLQLMDVKNYHAGGGEIFDYYNGGRGGGEGEGWVWWRFVGVETSGTRERTSRG